MPPGISASDFYNILPELVMTSGALVVLIVDVLLPKERRGALAWVTLLAIGATLAALVPFRSTHVEVAHGLLAVDQFALFFKVLFLGAAAITIVAEGLRRIEDTTLLYGMSQIILAVIFIVIITFRRDGLLGQREIALDRLFAPGWRDRLRLVRAGAGPPPNQRPDQTP